ncbi:MAG: hypothetical protein WCA81_00405 [Rhizomicrobium sp.]
MIFWDGTACAVGILRHGQKKGEARSGTTGEPFDEPTTQNPTALRVSRWQASAALRRSTDVPASPFAPRLAAYAAAQLRSALYLTLPTGALA